jgi:hypothetical protein
LPLRLKVGPGREPQKGENGLIDALGIRGRRAGRLFRLHGGRPSSTQTRVEAQYQLLLCANLFATPAKLASPMPSGERAIYMEKLIEILAEEMPRPLS